MPTDRRCDRAKQKLPYGLSANPCANNSRHPGRAAGCNPAAQTRDRVRRAPVATVAGRATESDPGSA